jgi:cytochrome c553
MEQTMKRTFVASLLLLAMASAWAADVRKGEQMAQQQCASCHGKDFVTPIDPTYPKLAGQYADYLEKALRDYKSGRRKNAIMAGQAKPLSNDDIGNLAAYLSGLPGPLSNEKR